MRMSHEEERAEGVGIVDQPERAPPHGLIRLLGDQSVPFRVSRANRANVPEARNSPKPPHARRKSHVFWGVPRKVTV